MLSLGFEFSFLAVSFDRFQGAFEGRKLRIEGGLFTEKCRGRKQRKKEKKPREKKAEKLREKREEKGAARV